MPSVTDLRISELAALGFSTGSLRDRQMTRFVSMGAVSGSYTDRAKALGQKLFPEQPYAPLGGAVLGNPVFVQTKTANTSAAAQIAATFDVAPTVGNTVFVIAGCPTAGVAASVPPDQAGFTKVSDRFGTATTGYWMVYAKKIVGGEGSTFSWTSPVGTNSHIILVEFSGMPAFALDPSATTNDSAGVAVLFINLGPTAAPNASNNSLVFFVVCSNTVNTGFAQTGTYNALAGTNRLTAWYKVQAAAQVESNGYSQTGTGRLSAGLIPIGPGSS